MKQLTVTVQIIVNDEKMTWNDFCHRYPDEADEIIQRMVDVKNGLTGIVFEKEEKVARRTPVKKGSFSEKGSFNEKVLQLIAREGGISTEELIRLTKTNKKKIWNIIYFLRAKKGYKIQKIGDNYQLIM